MDTPASSRSRAFDMPKPETDLAEWTSKIKAMQREVDADEEAEQKRLEEEITASRLARLRRGQGAGYVTGSNVSEDTKATRKEHGIAKDDGQKKVEVDGWRTQTVSPGVGERTSTASTKKPEAMSLAAFIGGRATAPRLNRHAPQQDAHDPTQFEQQTQVRTPHPVFGKGGVAMPGMTSMKGTKSPSTRSVKWDIDEVEPSQPASLEEQKDRRSSSSFVTGKYMETLEERPMQHSKPVIRERTTSTPAFLSSAGGSTHSHHSSNRAAVNSPSWQDNSRASSRSIDRSATGTERLPIITSRPITPRQKTPPPMRASISTPSLARPILPEPKHSPQAPQIPSSQTPSPAFLRLPSQKEPSPSISRLQGRGFVHKISTQLDSPPPPSSVPETSRTGGGRKSSVLDRWQPGVSTNSPPPSPNPIPLRNRTYSVNNLSEASRSPKLSMGGFPKTAVSTPSVMKSRSLPMSEPSSHISSQFDPISREASPGLGSATTMMVYKPGSDPKFVDELGVKHGANPELARNVSASSSQLSSDIPASSGKTLIHPTKGRARKPQKPKAANATKAHQTSSSRAVDSPHIPTQALASRSPVSQSHNTQQKSPLSTSASTPSSASYQASVVSSQIPRHRAHESDISTSIRPEEKHTDPVPTEKESSSTSAPARHSRIPNTGIRATVMDVARSMSEAPPPQDRGQSQEAAQKVSTITTTLPTTVNELGNVSHSNSYPEKPSHDSFRAAVSSSVKEEEAPMLLSGTTGPETHVERRGDTLGTSVHALKPVTKPEIRATGGADVVHLKHEDMRLPIVDIEVLVNSRKPSVDPHSDVQTISVDVMAVNGTTATALEQNNTNIFYDTEILAIVHRTKSKTSGLVSTTLWSWQGKRSKSSEKEDRKLKEIANRYGTTTITTQQHAEPVDLVRALGGQLAIRQGTRTHWTPENTSMHLVRSYAGIMYFNEHDLSVKNLCSAFSYCLSILNTIYVWHGCGSTLAERQAAVQYAQMLSTSGSGMIELSEGETDDDEMFWMILGNESFAKADYWKWRKSSSVIDPKVWRVDAHRGSKAVVAVDLLSNEKSLQESVYIIDCVWELFVLIGRKARGHRLDIKTALTVAMSLASQVSSHRPHTPNVHVLVLPTQIPVDLKLNLRDLDESLLNEDNVPNHMNILSSSDALDHLQMYSWDRAALADETMLPLGVDPSSIH